MAKPFQLFHGCSQSCVLAILSSEQTLRNVAAGIFFPFPLITDKSICTEGLGCGQHLAHYVLLPPKSKLPRYTRKSCLGWKTFSGLSSLSSIPPAPQFLPCNVYCSKTSPRLRRSAKGLQSLTSAPGPALSAALHAACTCCLFW